MHIFIHKHLHLEILPLCCQNNLSSILICVPNTSNPLIHLHLVIKTYLLKCESYSSHSTYYKHLRTFSLHPFDSMIHYPWVSSMYSCISKIVTISRRSRVRGWNSHLLTIIYEEPLSSKVKQTQTHRIYYQLYFLMIYFN